MIPETSRRTRAGATVFGAVAGAVLGFAAILDGFVGFIVVAFLGLVGLLIGLVVDGRLDPLSWIDRDRRDR